MNALGDAHKSSQARAPETVAGAAGRFDSCLPDHGHDIPLRKLPTSGRAPLQVSRVEKCEVSGR